MICVFVLFILLTAFLIYRRKIKADKEKQIMMAQKENTELEKEKLMLILTSKRKDLSNLASQIIEKDNLIKEIIEKVNKVQADNYSNAVKTLRTSIKMLNLNKSRDDYFTQLEELHKDFLFRLNERNVELTGNEKKLAVLLLMEHSSKEISVIVNISPKSVESNRYRLRKKLNLDSEIDLTDFMKSI